MTTKFLGQDYNTVKGIAVQMLLDNPLINAVHIRRKRDSGEFFIEYNQINEKIFATFTENRG